MAWSWSHSPEAYTNARLNLEDLSLDIKVTILSEWYVQEFNDLEETPRDYDTARTLALARLRRIGEDWLNEIIWARASEQALCDNGGWYAWLCPHGCLPHTVSFTREKVNAD